MEDKEKAGTDLCVQSFLWLCPGNGVEESLYFAQPKITSNLQTGIPRSAGTQIISIKFLQYSYCGAVVEMTPLCSSLLHFVEVFLCPYNISTGDLTRQQQSMCAHRNVEVLNIL